MKQVKGGVMEMEMNMKKIHNRFAGSKGKQNDESKMKKIRKRSEPMRSWTPMQ